MAMAGGQHVRECSLCHAYGAESVDGKHLVIHLQTSSFVSPAGQPDGDTTSFAVPAGDIVTLSMLTWGWYEGGAARYSRQSAAPFVGF